MAGILLNLLAAAMGGQITRATAFLSRFRQYCPEQRLVVLTDPRFLPLRPDGHGYEVRSVSTGRGPLRPMRRTVWENLHVPRLMRREGLDVYLTFSHYLPMGLQDGVRSVVGVSTMAPFSARAWQAERGSVRAKLWLQRRSIVASARRATCVIALSEACRTALAGRGVDSRRIAVISNGVEAMPEDPGGETSVLPAAPYILSVSHFHRYKNYERLIEAYARLPRHLREGYRLVLVGEPCNRRYFEELNELARRCEVEQRMTVIQGLDRRRLGTLYRRAALFVFPSLVENSPNILLEAMTCGLPIVASSAEPMPEFGGETVRYFDPTSAEDLAQQIARLLLSEDCGSALGSLARERAARYSWDVFTERVAGLCCPP